ncbi:MAG: branched-chain amino acid ABC transporter ATP-binding protein/permease [Alphaproteobacteria bacterium]
MAENQAILVQCEASPLLSGLSDAGRTAAMVAIPVLAIWAFLGGAEQSLATNFLVMLTAALGFAAFSANSGVLSFGHAAFMGLAAHISALLTMPAAVKASALPDLPAFLAGVELPFLASLAVTVALVALLAFVVGIPICRLGGSEAAIATLGLLMIAYSVLVGARELTRGSQALYGIPQTVDIVVGLALAVAALFVVRGWRDSRWGLMLRAVREDEPAAMAIGIRPDRARLASWTLSGAVAALAGVMLGHFLTVFSPQEFYFDLTFAVLVMLIVGGFASTTGAVVGAVLVTVLIEILRRIEQSGLFEAIGIGQVFGLTEIGLSVAVLWVLYRHNDGLLGHRELTDLWPLRRRGPADPAAPPAPAATGQDAPAGVGLVVRGMGKTYGGVVALDGVDMAVAPGEIVGLIGPNGSGKTTLLGCIAGTHEPTAGAVTADGTDLTGLAPYAVARRGIGRTFQTLRPFGRLTALDNVAAAVTAAGRVRGGRAQRAAARALLATFGIAGFADREARTLAYGQQRRLEIARAMALEPRYLLLDEPAAGLNDAESDDLLATLEGVRRRHGLGILIVDHDLRLIMRLCDRIVVLNKGGVIADGTPDQVRRDPAVRTAYLGSGHDAAAATATSH